MNRKKHLSFASLRHKLSSYFHQVEDRRQSSKSEYSLHDALMSGFACMHLQDPSLLHFQKRLEEERGLSNLQNLFGVTQIPESTQMREIIDQVPPSSYSGMFREVCYRLQRGKHLESYRILEGRYLCSIDGTQFFSSPTIHCDQCLETHHATGQITYSHKVLQSALMHPDHQEVIPLGSEEISNQDGTSKQDCERNAAKRLIPRLRQEHPRLKLILLGDDLFSSQPNIEATLAEKMDFIYVPSPLLISISTNGLRPLIQKRFPPFSSSTSRDVSTSISGSTMFR
jgi:hypothetical protein